ncbi:LacI family DNA-binding transcriptional regulator [Microbacterium karelineae]|uniref:LacI family DNA-binding transcriptional regulator n=1 Tax=Microbacterium karelineae TaxID=2654283 RepID=UPI001E5D8DDC|nr:LacI family DNA-binding transcriptional regulator [Microbacterium karelineae]
MTSPPAGATRGPADPTEWEHPDEEAPLARVTLQTIADEVGVSRMTVSNAFSRPDQLSSELREKILDTARRLEYAGPDPSARALVRGRTNVVGMVLTEDPRDAFRDDVAIGFVRAATERLAEAGYSLALLHSGSGDNIPARDVAMDGTIVYACTPQSEAVQHLLRRRLPIVRVEGLPVAGVADVSLDDAAGAAEAARHLLDLGHRDIALIVTGVDADDETLPAAPDTPHAPMERRIEGWESALRAAGVDPRYVGTPGPDLDTTLTRRIGRMLDSAPTAVLAYSDLAAMEVIEQAQARGIDVPSELSVIGFDDNPIAERVRPRLTTVHQDVVRKGELAADLLLAQLRGEAVPRIDPLPTTLVVRETTTAPRTR